jgi:beta-xylosidase
VVAARGRYYLYYSARRRSDNLHCLAVATARRPAGPFRDRGIVSCRSHRRLGYIDPAPLVYRGHAYLYFSVDGPRHSISALPLRRNLLRARGRPRTLFTVSRPWQKGLVSETVEGPSPVRRGGRFYLFYSTGCWCLDYRMGYAVSRHPLGPFRDARANPVLRGRSAVLGPGGGSVFKSAGGRSWLAFHAWSGPPVYARGGVRSLRIAPIAWRAGKPRVGLR